MRTRSLPIALCLISAVGCMSAEVNVPLDLDGDGLLSDIEAQLGTDPNDPDSDGDEWSDGDEYDQNTDPLDDDSKPYRGGWQIDPCRDDISATGDTPGKVASNFSPLLADQHGDEVSLHDFCNRVVLLIGSAFW
jgi:hypothetical protein